jgi:outer membrane protein OmpA-like peptidoglycan-associated protein
MKLRTIIICILMCSACTAKKSVVMRPMPTHEVHFGFAKDRLPAPESGKLQESVTYLKDSPEKMVVIEGHTDAVGPVEYNLELGDRRAREVKHFLVTHGVAPDQIVVVSYGEENLKDPHHNNVNRRAVVRLTSSNGGKQK